MKIVALRKREENFSKNLKLFIFFDFTRKTKLKTGKIIKSAKTASYNHFSIVYYMLNRYVFTFFPINVHS